MAVEAGSPAHFATWPRWRGSIASLTDLALTMEEIVTGRTGDARAPTFRVSWNNEVDHDYPVRELKDRLDARRLRRAYAIHIFAEGDQQRVALHLWSRAEPAVQLRLRNEDQDVWSQLRALIASGVPRPRNTDDVRQWLLVTYILVFVTIGVQVGNSINGWVGLVLGVIAAVLAMVIAYVGSRPLFAHLFPSIELLSPEQLAKARVLRWALPPLPVLLSAGGLIYTIAS